MTAEAYEEVFPVPGAALLRFPVELAPPPGFKAQRVETWPRVNGRLEFIKRRLLYMPPCGDDQQDVAVSVVALLHAWVRQHPSFVVGGNEAGMTLAGETRGADAAVWARANLPPNSGGFRRTPPVLAVEVSGRDEDEAVLLVKSRWYFRHGVKHVWLVFPKTREVVALNAGSTRKRRFRRGDQLPSLSELPGLLAEVDDFFDQLS